MFVSRFPEVSFGYTRRELTKFKVPENNPSVASFSDYSSEVIKILKATGIIPLNEQWFIEWRGSVLYGSININPKSIDGAKLKKEGFFNVVIRHSTNRKYAPTCICCAKIDILGKSYWISLGEVGEKKRQWQTFDLQTVVEGQIAPFYAATFYIQSFIIKLKKNKLHFNKAYGIICQVAERGIMPYRNIKYVVEKFNQMRNKNGLTLWKSFDASYCKLGIPDQFKMLNVLPLVFSEALGVTILDEI